MSIREIVKFPDSRLRQKASTIVVFDDRVKALADDLLDTLRSVSGIGITGPHIGEPWRIMVLELSPGDVCIYVNPTIDWQSAEDQGHEEGSVSMPDASEIIRRPARVRVTYQDLAGTQITDEADGLLAVCLQHEIDQLDGIFWTQRLSRLKREILVKKWRKQQNAK
jgi:peptide deformylase